MVFVNHLLCNYLVFITIGPNSQCVQILYCHPVNDFRTMNTWTSQYMYACTDGRSEKKEQIVASRLRPDSGD